MEEAEEHSKADAFDDESDVGTSDNASNVSDETDSSPALPEEEDEEHKVEGEGDGEGEEGEGKGEAEPVIVESTEKERTHVPVLGGKEMKASLYAQIMNKYEKTAIIGTRAQQIASGSEIYVPTFEGDNPISIAERELLQKKIPFQIVRRLPNGLEKVVNIDDLISDL